VKKILVVEDSPIVREQVRMALAAEAYQLVDAVDGVDGLSKLQADPTIALILCDVNMPRMNGLDLLEAWNRVRGPRKVPFVLLTSEAQPSLIDRAKKAGAVGWMVKPFQPHMLLAVLRKLAT
jgi:two-component system chemotaxis response regulator CheY